MMPIHIGPRERIYENPYQQIFRVSLRFEGFRKELFVNEMGKRVGLLICNGENVMLVRQYRFLVNALAWELPGGKVDETETVEEAAVREGLEEAGLRCRSIKPLLYFHPGLDTHHNPTFIFYSGDFIPEPASGSGQHEVCEHRWIPLCQCLQMIFAREIVDSLTVAGLLAFHTLKMHPELARPQTAD